MVIGSKCNLEVLLHTDGTYVYFCCTPGRTTKGKIMESSTSTELIAHLSSGHVGHALIPDIELISAMPQARGVPTMALTSIRDMRCAGMSLSAIYNSLKVYLCILQQVCCCSCNKCVAALIVHDRSTMARKLGSPSKTFATLDSCTVTGSLIVRTSSP